jgi:hypothetical protein
LFNSELPNEDRQEIAISYLDYVFENAVTISQIKAVETKLKENGLDVVPTQVTDSVKLGKRARTE